MPPRKDYSYLIGATIGRLTVVSITDPSPHARYAICTCACEPERHKRITLKGILAGKSQSCGCLRRENAGAFYTSKPGYLNCTCKTCGIMFHGKPSTERIFCSRACEAESRRLPLNEHVFDKADTDPVAQYWIGLLMADGFVSRRKPGDCCTILGLTLAVKDIHHVEAFRAFLGSSHAISVCDNTGFGKDGVYKIANFRVTSQHLCDTVSRYGIGPDKTYTAEVKRLEMSPAFWRGLCDGDGCVEWRPQAGSPSPRIRLIGTHRIVEQFREFVMMSICHDRAIISKSKSDMVSVCTVNGRYAKDLACVLYGDNPPIALPRKLALARELIEWKPRIQDRSMWTLEFFEHMLSTHGNLRRVAAAMGVTYTALKSTYHNRLTRPARPIF